MTFWDMGGYGQYNCRIMNTTIPDDTEFQTGSPTDTLIFHQEVSWSKKVRYLLDRPPYHSGRGRKLPETVF